MPAARSVVLAIFRMLAPAEILPLAPEAAVSVQNTSPVAPQITVLDTGGQYTHLIARRIREWGVYAAVPQIDTPLRKRGSRKGILISGGPRSGREAGTPDIAPAV